MEITLQRVQSHLRHLVDLLEDLRPADHHLHFAGRVIVHVSGKPARNREQLLDVALLVQLHWLHAQRAFHRPAPICPLRADDKLGATVRPRNHMFAPTARLGIHYSDAVLWLQLQHVLVLPTAT